MSEKQIQLLKDNNYEVLTTINYIRNKSSDYPIAYIEYNKNTNRFSLNFLKSELTNLNEINNAENEINQAFKLIKELNII